MYKRQFQFPHHGAAVGADVIRQGAEGEGQGKAQAVLLGREDAEAAQQLFPNGAAGEHLHPLAEGEGLPSCLLYTSRRSAEAVFRQVRTAEQ